MVSDRSGGFALSGSEQDLAVTDRLAQQALEDLLKTAPAETAGQLQDNLRWIKQAQSNKLVVGSKARILYAHAEGRIKIAAAF
ncbi:MAG: hypothetical protein KatS3mg032_0169 [Cyclobacteriaceae bacterium]|nr:MAG: hypothetical protein KatS3mg032_0169 [Cyclobacteriaceae bacterium]